MNTIYALDTLKQDAMVIECKKHILGHIRACDPCSFASLMGECREQAYDHTNKIDFNEICLYYRTFILDQAVCELLGEHQIITEISMDSEGPTTKWDVAFRQV